MNLLLLDQFSDLGGAQLCLLDLLPAVNDRGWRPLVAAPGDGPLLERAKQSGAAVARIHPGIYGRGNKSAGDVARYLFDVPRLSKELRELIEKHRIDVVYVNGPRVALPAVLATRRRLPVVYHCHSYVPAPYGSLLVGRPLAVAGATVIANSRFTASSLGRYRQLRIVYNGVADQLRTRSTRTVQRVGVIGRISPQKGHFVFVEAARLLHQSRGNVEFEICGACDSADPYYRKVIESASGLPVVFTGWTDDVPAVLAGLDVLVVPSLGPEATTRVILEAYSAGVLTIASNTGAIPEVLEHGRTGVLVDSPSPQAFASAIHEMLAKDDSYRCEMAQNARSAWQSRFTLARYQAEVLDLIESAKKRAE